MVKLQVMVQWVTGLIPSGGPIDLFIFIAVLLFCFVFCFFFFFSVG